MIGQTIVALAIVALALAWLIARAVRRLRPPAADGSGSACSGCAHGCATPPAATAQNPRLTNRLPGLR